jgi:predicted nucleic acid-binding protein
MHGSWTRACLHGPRQVTDAYLLALAVAHGGRFVTFDRSLSLASVHGASEDHMTIL